MNYIWREIQLMKKLSKIKDNVFTTKLYNVIETEDAENPGTKYVYLIMEYMTMDLQKIIEENPFDNSSEDHLVIIFYNLLCAMSFLHKLGLIHRDIKPANILIDENCQVKICDFGFATPEFEIDQKSGSKRKRSLSPHVQARNYRAPEVILTQKEYDSKIDVWSLGCVFSELALLNKTKAGSASKALFRGSSCFPLSPKI